MVSASPVWELGDKIGARMAFKSAYARHRRRSADARPATGVATVARLGPRSPRARRAGSARAGPSAAGGGPGLSARPGAERGRQR
ncbi:MAG: hypothetical protein MZV65_31950 [Chromatiales bacterium]|nr:hypothetical protein [Chromatiales bacterium]